MRSKKKRRKERREEGEGERERRRRREREGLLFVLEQIILLKDQMSVFFEALTGSYSVPG